MELNGIDLGPPNPDRVVRDLLDGKITTREAMRRLYPPSGGAITKVLCVVCLQLVPVEGLGLYDDGAQDDVIKALQAQWQRNWERDRERDRSCGHALA